MKSRYIEPEIHFLMINGKNAIMDYGMGDQSQFAEDPDTKRRFDDFDEGELLKQDRDEKLSLW
jgi:hypothetical protein